MQSIVKKNADKNLVKIVSKIPEKKQEQLITTLLKRKISDVNEKKINSKKIQNVQLSLSTYGSKLE